ncbi:MAG: hypothetical protein ACKO1W_04755 [Microcystaceae cyanobacterium]
MERETYLLHRDGLGRFLLQSTDTGVIQGLLWAANPQESARAFSYDYGSIWYPDQIVNLAEFPELAEMPFFAIESGGLDTRYFREEQCREILPMVGTTAKLWGYYVYSNQFMPPSPHLNWQYTFPNPEGSWTMPIFGLWVNDQGCWLSNQSGWIIVVNHQGELIQQFKLKHPTRFLTEGFTEQDDTPIVSCEDGFLYELTGKVPQSIYSLRSPIPYLYRHGIVAMVKSENLLFIADLYGQLFCVNESYETQWQRSIPDHWLSFFLGSDHDYLYQGYYQGLIAYEKLTGTLTWEIFTPAPVICGAVLDKNLLIGCSDRQIYQVNQSESKPTLIPLFQCSGIPYEMITDTAQQRLLVSDSDGKIYHWDFNRQQLDSMSLPKGAVLTMKIWHSGLYGGTSLGDLFCFDLAGLFPRESPT